MSPLRSTALALALLLAGGAQVAVAHQLNVFASVVDGHVVVEAKFSTGRVARAAKVTVYNDYDAPILMLELGEDGTARFPIPQQTTGIKVEVEAADGHSDYWILTANDLEGAPTPNGARP